MSGGTSVLDLISTANFDEPTPFWNHSAVILGLTVSAIVISWICAIFRLYARIYVTKAAGLDDLFLIMFIISGAPGAIVTCLSVNWGLGQHFLLVGLEDLQKFFLAFYIGGATYIMQTTFMKLSLLYQYLRVLKPDSKWRVAYHIMVVITALSGIVYGFMAWFPCFPPSAFWKLQLDGVVCYGFGNFEANSVYATWASATAFNVVMDVAVFALALPLYFQKDPDSQKTRFGPAILMVVGIIVNLLSIGRLVTIVQHKATTYPVFDPTWYATGSIVFGVLEVNLASVCACVPVFWPVITQSFNSIMVTHEIKVTHTERPYSPFVDGDDHVRLKRGASIGEDSSVHSRSGSLGSQRRLTEQGQTTVRPYYSDSYVMDQVDPLRQMTTLSVKTEVVAGGPEEKKSKK